MGWIRIKKRKEKKEPKATVKRQMTVESVLVIRIIKDADWAIV